MPTPTATEPLDAFDALKQLFTTGPWMPSLLPG
jgi:hypothetical protein